MKVNFPHDQKIGKQGDWMTKVDLKDAYYLIPIHQSNKKYLCIQWRSRTYEFHCLPLGLSHAPQVSPKTMKPVVALPRKRDKQLIIYLNDILIISKDSTRLTVSCVYSESYFGVRD